MSHNSIRGKVVIFLVMTVALVVAACGTEATSSTTTSSPETTTSSSAPTTATTAETTTTAAESTTTTAIPDSNDLASGSGCTPGPGDFPDGEWFGFVTVRASTAIDFDLACWFFGDAAAIAAAEDGEESPPANDYYIRNQSDRIRTLSLAERVEVVHYPDGDPNNALTIAYADWADFVDQRGLELGVWLAVDNGVVAAIEEQWVP